MIDLTVQQSFQSLEKEDGNIPTQYSPAHRRGSNNMFSEKRMRVYRSIHDERPAISFPRTHLE
jgi:hypothetical protein